jgi:predicted transposase YbfD/YdcC
MDASLNISSFFDMIQSSIKSCTPHRANNTIYSDSLLWFCYYFGLMSGCKSQRSIVETYSYAWPTIRILLEQYCNCSQLKRPPSQATFSRFINNFNLDNFKQGFFARKVELLNLGIQEKDIIHLAIDGKARKGVKDEASNRTEADLMVFDVETHSVLGSKTLAHHQGESKAAAECLAALLPNVDCNVLITGDAGLLTPALTAEIRKHGKDYCLGLKGNAGKVCELAASYGWKKVKVDSTEVEVCRGNTIQRKVKKLTVRRLGSDEFRKYQDASHIIQVTKTIGKNGAVTSEIRYYVASKQVADMPNKQISKLIRDHWKQENCLHWAKDVEYHEDNCRVKSNKGSRTLAIMRNIAVESCKLMGQTCGSVKNIILGMGLGNFISSILKL